MQKIRQNYNHTLYASYLGYITQAIVNTFIPLLFLTFQSSYQISLDKITSLVTINFGIQLIVDLLSTKCGSDWLSGSHCGGSYLRGRRACRAGNIAGAVL